MVDVDVAQVILRFVQLLLNLTILALLVTLIKLQAAHVLLWRDLIVEVQMSD